MDVEAERRFIALLKMNRGKCSCSRVQEDAACRRIRFLRTELASKAEALRSLRDYISSLPPMSDRRANAYQSQEAYRGEHKSIKDELDARERILFDECSCKCQ